MNNIPTDAISDPSGNLKPTWRSWLSQIYVILFSVQQSGTTAQRPVDATAFWIGRRYYDTTLNKPVYISSVSGVTATWKDAAGNTV